MLIICEIQRALRSLFLHLLRSFLSTLGVAAAVAAVIAMLSIGEGAKQESLEQIEQLGANSLIIRRSILSQDLRRQALEQQSLGLTLEDAAAIGRHLPFPAFIAPLKEIEGTVRGSHKQISPEILAVTRAFGEMKGLQMEEGRFICTRDQKEKKRVCVLGKEIAKELGKGGHAGGSLVLRDDNYEIIGVLKSTQWKEGRNQLITARNLDRTLFIPLGSEASIAGVPGYEKGAISEIILGLANPKDMEPASRFVKMMLDKLHGNFEDFQIVKPIELIQQAYRTQRTFNWILGGIAGISQLVGGIGVMNIMLATVSERTREIGIRRALGATRRNILFQFLLETVVLTLIGAFLGVFFGIGLSYFIAQAAGWNTIVTLWSIFLAMAAAVAAGLGSGLYPAYKASLMNPVQALRHE